MYIARIVYLEYVFLAVIPVKYYCTIVLKFIGNIYVLQLDIFIFRSKYNFFHDYNIKF